MFTKASQIITIHILLIYYFIIFSAFSVSILIWRLKRGLIINSSSVILSILSFAYTFTNFYICNPTIINIPLVKQLNSSGMTKENVSHNVEGFE